MSEYRVPVPVGGGFALPTLRTVPFHAVAEAAAAAAADDDEDDDDDGIATPRGKTGRGISAQLVSE